MQIHEQLRGPTLWTKAPQIVLRFHALGQRSANSSDCSSWTPTPNSSNRSHLRTQMHSSSEIPTVDSEKLGSLRQTALLTASSTGLNCKLCGCWMTVHPEGFRTKNRMRHSVLWTSWPLFSYTPTSGKGSVTPDSCIFPHTEKHENDLRVISDLCVS